MKRDKQGNKIIYEFKAGSEMCKFFGENCTVRIIEFDITDIKSVKTKDLKNDSKTNKTLE